jgi:hypothetical protein
VVRAATAAEHIDVREAAQEIAVLGAELFGVAASSSVALSSAACPRCDEFARRLRRRCIQAASLSSACTKCVGWAQLIIS